jgi:hypothetical protein
MGFGIEFLVWGSCVLRRLRMEEDDGKKKEGGEEGGREEEGRVGAGIGGVPEEARLR